ncbi:MAG: alpha/beta hydrolase [Gammaproteobacteria bacterium]|nr:alpha/beta hydrolase [Gammaproteobacteria bacterium]
MMNRLFATAFVFFAFTITACAPKPTAPVPYGDNAAAAAYAEVNGIRLYYESYGSGEPVLVIHGNGETLASMRFQIVHFAARQRVIAADSRGHGKSGLGTDQLTYVQMMEDYNALLEKLRLEHVNVIGWSDGGILGLLLAIHHPDKVGKLAVMGANLRPDETAVNSWTAPLLAPVSAMIDEKIQSGDTSTDWRHSRQLMDLLMHQPDIPVEDLGRIQAPVLVLAGDRDIIRNEHTLEIFDHIPQAHLAILPGQTHWAPMTDPDGFNALVAKFFDTPYTRPESRELLQRALNPE